MPGKSTFPFYNAQLAGTLPDILRALRATDPPTPYDVIAVRMREEHGIEMDPDTWRRWIRDYVEADA
jgi:hypothetical protein